MRLCRAGAGQSFSTTDSNSSKVCRKSEAAGRRAQTGGQTQIFFRLYLLKTSCLEVLSVRGSLSGRPSDSGGGQQPARFGVFRSAIWPKKKLLRSLKWLKKTRQVKPDPIGSIPNFSAVHSHKQRKIKRLKPNSKEFTTNSA